LDSHRDDRFEDLLDFSEPVRYEERRPAVPQQRLSALSIHDDMPERRPRADRVKSSDLIPSTQNYLYYRLAKTGDDWSSIVKDTISAPIDQIEKKARKGSKGVAGEVLEQMTRMGRLRRDQIEQAVQSANARSPDAHWEVVYIKARKNQKRSGNWEVPEMDIILAKTKARPSARTKTSSSVEVVSIKDVDAKGGKQKKYVDDGYKQKKYVDDGYSRGRKDSVLEPLEDPINNLALFDHDGRPRNEFGPIHFNNAGLPPQISREKPLGAPLAHKEDKPDKRDKSRKRSKSRDKGRAAHEDDVLLADDFGGFLESGDPATVDAMFGEVKPDQRGRRGKSPHPHPHDHPMILGADVGGGSGDMMPPRSHSRRRGGDAEGRGRGPSRDKSRHSRRESVVHFPNQHTRDYFEGSNSSEASDSSHFGFVEYAESSNTSLGGSGGGIPRRGSLAHDQVAHPEVVYRKHHPGPAGPPPPSRRYSYTEKPYYGEEHMIMPARTSSRRNSTLLYEPRPREPVRYERVPRLVRQVTAPAIIPEERQIMYQDPYHRSAQDVVMPVRRIVEAAPPTPTRYVARDVPAAVPILHYPDEERDPYYHEEVSSRVEDYQRARVRDEYQKRAEREFDARSRVLDAQEEEVRRMRQEQQFYDDRDRRERRSSRQYYEDKPAAGGYYTYDY
jgi:hypothetical protein